MSMNHYENSLFFIEYRNELHVAQTWHSRYDNSITREERVVHTSRLRMRTGECGMKYLISPEKKQYKANLHCHSTLSDGRLSPQELKTAYKLCGYDILAITDHERPHSHQALSDEQFLMITGYECYIRPNKEGKSKPYEKEVHLNLFAREPENATLICYNEPYCRYLIRDNALHEITACAGSERVREYTPEYVNEYIRTAKENGYIVAYNHPYGSREDEADSMAYEGCFSLEICNYASQVSTGLEHCGILYNKMLMAGKRMHCHAGDDNHNRHPFDDPENDSFGAFTMIMPEEFTYNGVIAAMEAGNMYASMGPVFKEVSLDGDQLHVECSEVTHIHVYNGGKRPGRVHARAGESLTCADFTIDKNARYVRVGICDAQGRWADTRGYFRDEIGFPPLQE